MNIQVSITDFGAQAGTEALQTQAIQRAIDHVFLQGGGEVVVPSGTFMTGDIRLRSHITLRLLSGAHLLGSRDTSEYFHYRKDTVEPLSDDQITEARWVSVAKTADETTYHADRAEHQFMRLPGSCWNNALIRAIDAKDVAIIGEEGAIIDGNNCYDAQGEENYRGPHGISFFGCTNVSLSGYTIKNTGNWAHIILKSDNITIDDVTVLAGHDGVHAMLCNNLIIRRSRFYTGDDCIAGYADVNVLVEQCICNSSCSAFRFGGTNVLINGCDIYGPGKYMFRGAMSEEEKKAGAPSPTEGKRRNCLSVFTYYADCRLPIFEQPGNILIENCRISNVDRFLHYNYSGNEPWQRHRPLKDITFRHIQAEGIAMPLTAYGQKDCPLVLTLSDVSVKMREETNADSFMHAAFFETLTLDNVTVEGFSGEALIKTWSEGDIRLNEVHHSAKEEVVRAEEPFCCKAI